VLLAELRDVAQAWWDWLPHGVQIALEDVMAAERETKTGPIFGRPLLGRDGNPLPFDPAAREKPAEWFRYKMALENFEWTNARLIAIHNRSGTALGALAGKLRLAWWDLNASPATHPTNQLMARMRDILLRGR
jgi:hypothetical protein